MQPSATQRLRIPGSSLATILLIGLMPALAATPTPRPTVHPHLQSPGTGVDASHSGTFSAPISTPQVHTHIRTSPRLDHSVNRTTIRPLHHMNPHLQLTTPHLQHPNIVNLRSQRQMDQKMLVGHDSKTSESHHHHEQRQNSGDSSSGAIAGAAGNDNGGADSSSSDSGTRAVNSSAVTTAQAQEFARIVRTRFGDWDLAHDGKLTTNEIARSLHQRQRYEKNEQAALAALGLALKNQSDATANSNRFYTLKGLTTLAKKAEIAHESALLRLYKLNADHLNALNETNGTKDAITNGLEIATVQEKLNQKKEIEEQEQENLSHALADFPLPPNTEADAAAAEVTKTFDKETARVKHNHGQVLHTSLDKGSILIAHENPVAVQCGQAEVTIAAGAVAYIFKLDGELAVYNLSDLKHGDVKVICADKTFRVAVGKQLLLTNQQQSFDQVNPLKEIISTKPTKIAGLHDTVIYSAEFSPTAALDNIAQFQTLVDSERPEDRKIAERIIKTAAIILTLNAGN